MINIVEFQQDLRNGVGLEEALVKYGMNLELAMKLCPQPYRSRKTHYRNGEKKVKYIVEREVGFEVRRHIDGRYVCFGCYSTLSEAIKIVNCCEKFGWDKSQLDDYKTIAGVEK